MTADPEILPPFSPRDDVQDDARLEVPRELSEPPIPEVSPQNVGWSTAGEPVLDAAPVLREVPNIGHTLALFALTALFWFLAEVACLGIAMMITPGHQRVQAQAIARDPRLLVASEAVGYALTAGFAALIFPPWWQRPFLLGIHWNWPTTGRRVLWLALLGLVVGLSMSVLGNFLPMPKDPPIVKDIMSTPAGAWVMFFFGVTGAPLFEELAFRGFLLPSLTNLFQWLGRREVLPPAVGTAIGVPLSVVLTTLPFALMHSPQVSDAWGPLLLIGLVSLVLCAVRLSLNSLAASTIVHSAYNFTLFAGIMVSTGGFRHLEKLGG